MYRLPPAQTQTSQSSRHPAHTVHDPSRLHHQQTERNWFPLTLLRRRHHRWNQLHALLPAQPPVCCSNSWACHWFVPHLPIHGSSDAWSLLRPHTEQQSRAWSHKHPTLLHPLQSHRPCSSPIDMHQTVYRLPPALLQMPQPWNLPTHTGLGPKNLRLQKKARSWSPPPLFRRRHHRWNQRHARLPVQQPAGCSNSWACHWFEQNPPILGSSDAWSLLRPHTEQQSRAWSHKHPTHRHPLQSHRPCSSPTDTHQMGYRHPPALLQTTLLSNHQAHTALDPSHLPHLRKGPLK